MDVFESGPAPRNPAPLVMIEGGINEWAKAHELVGGGNVVVARVHRGDHVSFEAYRVTDTSYAWRTSQMGAPAFAPVTPDTRPDVYGMPRWQWDMGGKA